MIELRHIKKVFPDTIPLTDVNTVIEDGEVISIIGPSGTGKSTLLRCINLLSPPTSGEILIDGVSITESPENFAKVKGKMGMVFQSFNLFNHQTVIENIMQPQIDLLGRSKQEAYDKAVGLLEKVGLSEKTFAFPSELSGGQKQRIAIARTLAMDPEIILFDEPTSALDPTMVGEVESVIRQLKGSGKTMIIVTHEMTFAEEISSRVFYMDEGIIYEDGSPEQIFHNPKKEKTKSFLRRKKMLEVNISSAKYDFLGIITKIGEFGQKRKLPPKLVEDIKRIFEELCAIIILGRTDEEPSLKLLIDHDPEDKDTDDIEITVKYGGETFNPMDSGNEIAIKIIKSKGKAYSYEAVNEQDYTNKVTVKL